MHNSGVKQKKSVKNHWIFGDNSTVHQKILVSCIILILFNSVLSFVIIHKGTDYPVTNSTIQVANTPFDSDKVAEHNKEDMQFRQYTQRSIMVLVLCSVLSLVFVMVFFMKSIADPLQAMEKTTKKLSNGDLDHMMPIQADDNDPIGKIGENVHELAINLQEILLLVWNISEQDLDVLKQTIAMLKSNNNQESHEKVLNNLQLLKKHRDDTQDLVREFELFHVMLKGKKLLAKIDTANF